MADTTMAPFTLDKLETLLRTFILRDDAAGVRDTVISLCAELDIPCLDDPSLVG